MSQRAVAQKLKRRRFGVFYLEYETHTRRRHLFIVVPVAKSSSESVCLYVLCIAIDC